MEVLVFTPASEILARLLDVDSDTSGLNANTLQGYLASDFALAGHTHSYQPLDAELTAIAGLISAANKVPYFTGLGAADMLTVGTAANNLVQLTAAAKLPAVDGSLLTNLPATGLATTGATTGATSQAQVLTKGVTTSEKISINDPTPPASPTATIIENDTDPSTGYSSATYIYGTPRIYLGKSGNTIYSLNFANCSNLESLPPLAFTGDVQMLVNGGISLIERSGSSILYNNGSFFQACVFGGINPSTSAIANHLQMRSTNAGTPAAGFGVGFRAGLKSSTTVDQNAGRLTWEWITATHASRASKGQLTSFYTSTERAAMTWGSDASGPLLGFGTVTTPIAIQVLATGAGATVDDVITKLQALGLVKQS